MSTLRPNAIRIKRFRELKATLRINRDRLLVGIDIGKSQHVAQLRVAHGPIVAGKVVIPNTTAGFAAFGRQVTAAQQATACAEVVAALEPTGTYHEALGRFLEGQGVDVVLVANQVAHANRKTLDGTWGKSDPKDAHNLCELLERGLVLFYSLADGPAAALRRLVRLLRAARVERAACQVRWRNTLRPCLGPAGEPLPAALRAQLPAAVQGWEPPAETLGAPRVAPPRVRRRVRRPRGPAPGGAGAHRHPGGGPGRGRGAPPGVPPAPDDPWGRPDGGGDPRGRDWGHRLVYEVLPAPEARRARHRPPRVGAVGGDAPDLPVWAGAPALGALPGRPGGGPHGGGAGLAGAADRQTPGGSARLRQGERGVGREAPAPGLGRLAERPAIYPGARRASDSRVTGPSPRGGSATATWRHRQVTAWGTQARLSRCLRSD